MKIIDQQKPVLVTGGTGYIASWIIKQLLEEGKKVRTTVRNLSDKKKYEHLSRMAESAKGSLSFFEADLLKKGSFLEAMNGCELVIHTASPFKISGLKDAQKELVEPALEGTRNVLESVNQTENVIRVVLTSSIVAVVGDAIDIQQTRDGIFTEADWNFSSSVNHQPYPYSKMLAEKLAWEMVGQQNRWDLVVINPGFVMGPSLSQRTDSTSIEIMHQVPLASLEQVFRRVKWRLLMFAMWPSPIFWLALRQLHPAVISAFPSIKHFLIWPMLSGINIRSIRCPMVMYPNGCFG